MLNRFEYHARYSQQPKQVYEKKNQRAISKLKNGVPGCD